MKSGEVVTNKLVIFDIDDTLVHTATKIHVVKGGHIVQSLFSHEFTHYVPGPGESFDFSPMANAQEFFEKSTPIIPMIDQLTTDINTGNKVVMITARSDFDDKELFLNTFRKYGVNMSKVHVYRAGNVIGPPIDVKKANITRKLLSEGNYTKVIMYDDSVPNLRAFLALHTEHVDAKFYAWQVSLDGETKEYGRAG